MAVWAGYVVSMILLFERDLAGATNGHWTAHKFGAVRRTNEMIHQDWGLNIGRSSW